MMKKTTCYLWCGGALVLGVVAGAVIAAYTGIPAIGKLGTPAAGGAA